MGRSTGFKKPLRESCGKPVLKIWFPTPPIHDATSESTMPIARQHADMSADRRGAKPSRVLNTGKLIPGLGVQVGRNEPNTEWPDNKQGGRTCKRTEGY